MSFKGAIEARCPNNKCEPFAAEIWSFIRGDQSPDLRLQLKFGECNLLLCDECGAPFFPAEPYVYFDPSAELLAFVFPESFRDREQFWRDKMRQDFAAMKTSMGEGMALAVEPQIFFGAAGLSALLEDEDYREEECQVMEHVARDLGLALYHVSPRYARENKIPAVLPFKAAKGGGATRENVVAGLETLLAANDRLTSYKKYLDELKKAKSLPPASTVKAA